ILIALLLSIFFVPALIISNAMSGIIGLITTSTWHHIVHPEIRARASGFLSITSLLISFSPFTGAWVYEVLGFQILLFSVIILQLIGIWIFVGYYDFYINEVQNSIQKHNQLVTSCA
ncbi:MAG: hypothetical protein ACFFDT_11450, partial [Candidatus Hodarchaeota archaeon]